MNKNRTLAIILISLGLLIIADKIGYVFGYRLGHLWSFLFPALMLILGYVGMRNGKWFIGLILFGFGLLGVLAKLSGLFIPLIAIALIWFGVSKFKGSSY